MTNGEAPPVRRTPDSLVGRLRRLASQRLFQGRVRLGDGRTLEPIRPEDLDDLRRRFPRPKFFVFGHPRSGTTLLARLVRAHPQVHCNWQVQFFSSRGPIPYFTSPSFDHWLRNSSNRLVTGWNPTAALLRACCDVILEREGEKAGKPIVGDKSPNGNGAQAIEWLAAVYPDAHLIYIVRDGRDTVLSRRIQSFLDAPQNLGRADRKVRAAFIRDPQPFLEKRRSIFTADWLRQAAERWGQDVDGSVAAGRSLFATAFAVVRYEDLLADPAGVMRSLWSFLGAATDSPSLDELLGDALHENPEAEWHSRFPYDFVQKLPRGMPGGWESLFTASDRRLFERAAGPTLAAWNYPHGS